MSKLILKDKTEIELSTHYGDTFVTVIDNFAKLDKIKDKLTDGNTLVMTVQNESNRIDALSNMMLELMNSDEEEEGNE